MSNIIAIQEILTAITLGAEKIKKTIELYTLEESCGMIQIHVDSTLENKDYSITLSSIVLLDENKSGCLFATGIDQNTENTYIILNPKSDDTQFVFENELYDSIEIAINSDFHELILGSALSSLTMKTVNSILNKLIVFNIQAIEESQAKELV